MEVYIVFNILEELGTDVYCFDSLEKARTKFYSLIGEYLCDCIKCGDRKDAVEWINKAEMPKIDGILEYMSVGKDEIYIEKHEIS